MMVVNLKGFNRNGGFKILAFARLSSYSYSIIMYILNCLFSGIDEVVSSIGELSTLLGVSEKQVKSALAELEYYNIIHITKKHEKTLIIKMLLNPEKWENLRTIPERGKRVLVDAKNLHSLVPQKKIGKAVSIKKTTLKENEKKLVSKTITKEKSEKLKKLAKNDEDGVEDILSFRKKNETLDEKVRFLAFKEIKRARKELKKLTPDEKLLLDILMNHEHPRKQLYWALKAIDRYPNLKIFLEFAKSTVNL